MVTSAVEKNKAGNKGRYYCVGWGGEFILIQWSGKAYWGEKVIVKQRFEVDEGEGDSRHGKQQV